MGDHYTTPGRGQAANTGFRMSRRRFVWPGLCALFVLIAVMVWTGAAGAQVTPPQPPASAAPSGKQAPVIHARELEVNVPVSVLDKRGLPVIDLSEKDFQIFENGKRQAITSFRQDPLPPLRVGLILDTSNSMRAQMDYEKDAAEEFVYNILEDQNTRNQIFLETFDESSSIIQGFTSDPDTLNTKIRALKAGGGKAMYDAIYNACENEMMHAGGPENTRRVIVLISDGLDVQSKHTLDEAVSMAHHAETSIFTIGNTKYGFSNPGDRYLADLTNDTGGWSFFPLEQAVGADLETGYLAHGTINEDGSQNMGLGAQTGIYTAQQLMHISNALQSLGRELDSEYSIDYRPADQNLNGSYRPIRVVVLRRGVRVRAKSGYFAIPQQQ
ncbi:MAG: VWA domain-containing protein [Terriglobia bacterium]